MVSCKFALVFLAFIATSLLPHSNASVTWTNKGHTSATSTYTYPGARYGATTWTDSNGALWMFSGVGTENTKSEGYLDQLYKFDFTTSKWSLVSGTTSTNQAGTYASIGSKGYPGGRYGAASWADASGNLWMFGGMGIGNEQGLEGPLSDLWKYNTATNTWIFAAGSPRVSAAATKDAPSARAGAVSWTDGNGNLYLFGGKAASSEYLHDLWYFSTTSNAWTKVHKDVSPKARAFAASWVDINGDAWIYGGQSRGSVLSDLWQFKNNAWTLKYRNGTSESNQNAVFPVIGGHGFPGSVHSAAAWTYGNGLFMFGGKTVADGKPGLSNNVWKFDIASNTWQYIAGTASLSAGSLSGPGARYSTVASIDKSGKVAVFGGSGYDSPVASAHVLGDTWTIDASSFAVKAPVSRGFYSARADNATTGLTGGSTSKNATTGASTSGTLTTGSAATSGSTSGSTSSSTSGSTSGSTGSSTSGSTGSSSSGSTSGATSTTSATPKPTSTPSPTSTPAPTSTPTPTGTPGPTSTPTPAPQTTTTATVTLQLAMTGDPAAVDTTSLASSVASSLGVDPNTVNATIVIDGKKRAVAFHVVITVFFPNTSAIESVIGGSTTGGSGAPNITAQLAVLQQAVTSAANSTAVQSVISSSGATVTGITATTTTEQVPVSTTGSTATTGTTSPTSAPTTTNKNSLASNVSPSFSLLFAAAAVFVCAYAL